MISIYWNWYGLIYIETYIVQFKSVNYNELKLSLVERISSNTSGYIWWFLKIFISLNDNICQALCEHFFVSVWWITTYTATTHRLINLFHTYSIHSLNNIYAKLYNTLCVMKNSVNYALIICWYILLSSLFSTGGLDCLVFTIN